MIVRVDRHGFAGSDSCDDFVQIHIAAGARAGLEDIDWKLIRVLARDNRGGGLGDGLAACRIEFAQLDIGSGGGLFDQRKRLYHYRRQAQRADFEIIECALGLRLVKRVYRNFDPAHAVAYTDFFVTHIAVPTVASKASIVTSVRVPNETGCVKFLRRKTGLQKYLNWYIIRGTLNAHTTI